MMNFIKNFGKNEDGAVTVDWVVLTAAVVGLAVAAYGSIESGSSALTAKITFSTISTIFRIAFESFPNRFFGRETLNLLSFLSFTKRTGNSRK